MHRNFQTFILRSGFAFLIALCSSLIAVSAQTTGGVKGKVTNIRGQDISGATITARLNGKEVRSTKTDKDGEFLLSGLEAGTYNIAFDARGYSTGVKYNVEIQQGKTLDLGDRLILQVDKGTQVIVQGSVYYKDGTSVRDIEVKIERVNADGSVKKLGTLRTNLYGEFAFRQPEGAAKFRMTVKYKGSTVSKEIEVDSAAVYRLALNLDVNRQGK